MEFRPLTYIYKSTGNPEDSTLVLFHGTGGDENDLVPLAKKFGDQFNILSFRGNVSEQGMPRFFKRLAMGVFDEDDIKFRTEELVHFIKEIAPKEGFDSSKLIALGYSNGANIIGATLMFYPDFLSGAILFRPMLPLKNVLVFPTTKNTPVFMSSGNLDRMVSKTEIENYKALLNKNNFDTEWHQINTGHNLTEEDVSLAVAFSNNNF